MGQTGNRTRVPQVGSPMKRTTAELYRRAPFDEVKANNQEFIEFIPWTGTESIEKLAAESSQMLKPITRLSLASLGHVIFQLCTHFKVNGSKVCHAENQWNPQEVWMANVSRDSRDLLVEIAIIGSNRGFRGGPLSHASLSRGDFYFWHVKFWEVGPSPALAKRVTYFSRLPVSKI